MQTTRKSDQPACAADDSIWPSLNEQLEIDVRQFNIDMKTTVARHEEQLKLAFTESHDAVDASVLEARAYVVIPQPYRNCITKVRGYWKTCPIELRKDCSEIIRRDIQHVSGRIARQAVSIEQLIEIVPPWQVPIVLSTEAALCGLRERARALNAWSKLVPKYLSKAKTLSTQSEPVERDQCELLLPLDCEEILL